MGSVTTGVLDFVVPFKTFTSSWTRNTLRTFTFPSALVQECNQCRCCTDATVLGGVREEFCSHPAGHSARGPSLDFCK